jgi:hypothetical protein
LLQKKVSAYFSQRGDRISCITDWILLHAYIDQSAYVILTWSIAVAGAAEGQVLAGARQDSAGDLPGEEDADRTKSNFFFVRLEWEVSYLASLCIKPSVLFM